MEACRDGGNRRGVSRARALGALAVFSFVVFVLAGAILASLGVAPATGPRGGAGGMEMGISGEGGAEGGLVDVAVHEARADGGVDVSVRHLGSSPRVFYDDDFWLVDAGGGQVQRNVDAAARFPDPWSSSARLEPGGVERGWLEFSYNPPVGPFRLAYDLDGVWYWVDVSFGG